MACIMLAASAIVAVKARSQATVPAEHRHLAAHTDLARKQLVRHSRNCAEAQVPAMVCFGLGSSAACGSRGAAWFWRVLVHHRRFDD